MSGEKSMSRRWLVFGIFSFLVLFPILGLFLLTAIAFQPTPAGEVTGCTATNDSGTLTIELTIEPVEISGRYFETHTFAQISDADEPDVIFTTSRPSPDETTCEQNILFPAEDAIVVWNGAAVAWSSNTGESWHMWELCDEPRPSFGCVDRERIEQVTVQSATAGQIDVFAPEGSYTLTTDDSGESWQLVTELSG